MSNLEIPQISPRNFTECFTVCMENIISLMEPNNLEFHEFKINEGQKLQQLIDQDTYRIGVLEVNEIAMENQCNNDPETNKEIDFFALE